MPQEIEHKYLVRLEDWKPTTAGVLYRQGYLSSVKERVVRVRIAEEQAYLTIKGLMRGITRLEFEYVIPVSDAATMLDLLCERRLIDIAKPLAAGPGTSMFSMATTKGSSSPRWRSPTSPNASKRRRGSGAKCPAILATSIPTSSATPTKIGVLTMFDLPWLL